VKGEAAIVKEFRGSRANSGDHELDFDGTSLPSSGHAQVRVLFKDLVNELLPESQETDVILRRR
jgi:hypothetical protein